MDEHLEYTLQSSNLPQMSAKDIIRILQLEPHPEGGYFKETWRSGEKLVNVRGATRNLSTAIYYLLENHDKSLFHRIGSDELWFFHSGNPIEIFLIEEGKLVVRLLGSDVEKGENPQLFVPAGIWFSAKIRDSKGYALVSCAVSPGFDFSDFELAVRAELISDYPDLCAVIEEFTS